MKTQGALWAIILGIAIIAGSWILGYYFEQSRAAQRYVTVKGLSEREVRADRASWTLVGTYGAESIAEAQQYIREHESKVVAFLTERGFPTADITTSQINVSRNMREQTYSPFTVDVRVMVETDSVDLVAEAAAQVSQLIQRGILLSGDRWIAGPRYFFTNFQDIKTEMLAEATQNARTAADEFAVNADSEVGDIKYANQGIFQILPGSRNNEQEEFYADKVIRVVTTVDFFLE